MLIIKNLDLPDEGNHLSIDIDHKGKVSYNLDLSNKEIARAIGFSGKKRKPGQRKESD